MFHVPEKYRVIGGRLATNVDDGNNGYFVIQSPLFENGTLRIIASDGMGWDHVSIHGTTDDDEIYIPTWQEMDFIKGLFWDGEDVVMQLHVNDGNKVNLHPGTLHLWKPQKIKIPLPPKALV